MRGSKQKNRGDSDKKETRRSQNVGARKQRALRKRRKIIVANVGVINDATRTNVTYKTRDRRLSTAARRVDVLNGRQGNVNAAKGEGERRRFPLRTFFATVVFRLIGATRAAIERVERFDFIGIVEKRRRRVRLFAIGEILPTFLGTSAFVKGRLGNLKRTRRKILRGPKFRKRRCENWARAFRRTVGTSRFSSVWKFKSRR